MGVRPSRAVLSLLFFALLLCLSNRAASAPGDKPVPATVPVAATNAPTLTPNILLEDGALHRGATNLAPALKVEPKPTDIKPGPRQQRKSDAMAQYSLGLIAENRGEFDAALAAYEKAVELDPAFVDLGMKVGFEYLRREQNAKAITLFQNLIKSNPRSSVAYSALSFAQRASGNKEAAILNAQKAIELDPAKVAPYQYLYEMHMERGQFEKALGVLEKASEQLAPHAPHWLNLGDMYATVLNRSPVLRTPDRVRRLEGFYKKALSLNPDELNGLLRMADFYVTIKNYDKAIEQYMRVITFYPDALGVREKMALTYAAKGDKKTALSLLEAILKQNPTRSDVMVAMGDIKQEAKDPEGALEAYLKALDINSRNLMAYIKIASHYLQEKQPQKAISFLQKAELRFPNQLVLTQFLAVAYREAKDFKTALAKFDEVRAKAKPGDGLINSDFYFDLGATYEQMGDMARAEEHLKKSIELNPENHAALNYLGYSWTDRNLHLPASEEMIRKALKMDPDNGAYIDSLGWVYFRQGKFKPALRELLRAAELIDYKDDIVLSHVAETYHRLGHLKDALAWQKWAVEKCDDPARREKLLKTLGEWEKEAAEKK
ncbi:MAG: tetratricopeptide repeat protein [Verrucomicrobiae bacterium]|nr:tetratricopeptide repeat protein [Verrucomicrobiae bacterium]